jgi:F-type H+-transporting ATPase subunit gamma
MATLRDIRKRISSVKSTQKITKAMKMVAAAKLRRAQMAVSAARPYVAGLETVMENMLCYGDPVSHPLFDDVSDPQKVSILIFTSNRGLCGGFNSNLLRNVDAYIKEHLASTREVDLCVVGKKGRDYYSARHKELKDVFIDWAQSFPFDEAFEMAQGMLQKFYNGECQAFYFAYNEFKSAMSQRVRVERLVPLQKEMGDQKSEVSETSSDNRFVDFIYEPSKQEVLEHTIPRYIAMKLRMAHLESLASELGARMTAMENATKNATEMISGLTLKYNRLRQAAITKELLDIVNGAEAIK